MPRFCSILILFFLLTSCDLNIFKETDTDAEVVSEKNNETLTLGSDPEKGKVVYYANCISCHNYNPKKPGSIGPQYTGLQKNFSQKKLIPEYIQKITNLKDQPK